MSYSWDFNNSIFIYFLENFVANILCWLGSSCQVGPLVVALSFFNAVKSTWGQQKNPPISAHILPRLTFCIQLALFTGFFYNCYLHIIKTQWSLKMYIFFKTTFNLGIKITISLWKSVVLKFLYITKTQSSLTIFVSVITNIWSNWDKVRNSNFKILRKIFFFCENYVWLENDGRNGIKENIIW